MITENDSYSSTANTIAVATKTKYCSVVSPAHGEDEKEMAEEVNEMAEEVKGKTSGGGRSQKRR